MDDFEQEEFLGSLKVMLYCSSVLWALIVPVIVIPFFAYYFDNYYLLFGIPIAYVSSFLGIVGSRLPLYFLLLCIGYGFWNGFNPRQYIIFFGLVSFCNFLFAAFADGYWEQIKTIQYGEDAKEYAEFLALTENSSIYQPTFEEFKEMRNDALQSSSKTF